jgi:hypothetical protein
MYIYYYLTLKYKIGTFSVSSLKVDGKGFTDYGMKVHLHVAPCTSSGGGHYKNDPSGPVDTMNEMWWYLDTINGVGLVSLTVSYQFSHFLFMGLNYFIY